MRKLRWTGFIVLTLFFFLIIIKCPLNEYEWMLRLDADTGITPETLPYDNSASMYPYIAGVPALLLCVFYFLGKTRREKMIVLSVIGILFVVWVIKFRNLLFGS